MNLLLEPHQDDAVLFASFTIIREEPVVVTALGDSVCHARYGVTGETRDLENRRALDELGDQIRHRAMSFSDRDPVFWHGVETDLVDLMPSLLGTSALERVYAPFPEPGGHPQHNQLGLLALRVYGESRVSFYTTYRFGGPKTTGAVEVKPEPEWVIRKLRAVACFESQIKYGPWRFFLDGLREYLSPPSDVHRSLL